MATAFYCPSATRAQEPNMLDFFWNYDQIAMAEEPEYRAEPDLDPDFDLDLDLEADIEADVDAKAAVLEISPLISYEAPVFPTAPQMNGFQPQKDEQPAPVYYLPNNLTDFDCDPFFYAAAAPTVSVPTDNAASSWPVYPAAEIARPDSPTLPSPTEVSQSELADLSDSAFSFAPVDRFTSPIGSPNSVPELSLSSESSDPSPASSPAHSRKNSNCVALDGPAPPFHRFQVRSHPPHPPFVYRRQPQKSSSGAVQTPAEKLGKAVHPTMKQRRNSQSSSGSTGAGARRRRSSATPAANGVPSGSKERTPHTEVERKYRQGINFGIIELGYTVPEIRTQMDGGAEDGYGGVASPSGSSRCGSVSGGAKVKPPSKLAIIQSATKYITELAGRSDEAEGRCRELERERDMERSRVAELEARLAMYEKCV